MEPSVALKRQLSVLSNLYPVRRSTIDGGDVKRMFVPH